MSCLNGTDCRETAKRRAALTVLALMLAIFLLLSVWSFLPSRGQAVPDGIQYGGAGAVEGKRVFQAYNCMGCHTIVGNGAYFGPDLTRIHADAGPAWLAAFLPSAGGWPTSAAVRVQLQNPAVREDAGTDDLQAYLRRYPGAAERLERRGGQHTLMPNLPLDAREVTALIAFLKYTSALHTEGWPPAPKVDGLTFPQATPMPVAARQAALSPAEIRVMVTGFPRLMASRSEPCVAGSESGGVLPLMVSTNKSQEYALRSSYVYVNSISIAAS